MRCNGPALVLLLFFIRRGSPRIIRGCSRAAAATSAQILPNKIEPLSASIALRARCPFARDARPILVISDSSIVLSSTSLDTSEPRENYTFTWTVGDLEPNTNYTVCLNSAKYNNSEYTVTPDKPTCAKFTTAQLPVLRDDSIAALCTIFGYFILSAIAGACTWKVRSIQMKRRGEYDMGETSPKPSSTNEKHNGAKKEPVPMKAFSRSNYPESTDSSPEKQPLNPKKPTCSIEEQLLV